MSKRQGNIKPAMAPFIHEAKMAAMNDGQANEFSSSRRSGTMADSPLIWMPMLPKLANPQSA
jgi:hypothetical protein